MLQHILKRDSKKAQMKMNPVVHLEMPCKDHKRVSQFYSKVLTGKWFRPVPEMGNYLVAHTTETDDQQMVKTLGNINMTDF